MPTPSSGSKSRRRTNAGGSAAGHSSSPSPPIFRSAFVFRVLEVDSQQGDFSATLWMPPAFMLSTSLSTSQLVSVSVCLQHSSDALDTSQVENLEQRCSVDFGVVAENNLEEVGSFYVVASAWPCSKLKEGVKISKQLACALGCSQALPHVRVKAIIGTGLNWCKGLRLPGTDVMEMDVQECQELVVRLCTAKAKDNYGDTLDSLSAMADTPEQVLVSKQSEASPLTPTNQQSKMTGDFVRTKVDLSSSSKSIQAASPKKFEKKNASQRIFQSKEQLALISMSGDKDGRTIRLLERLAGWLLSGRYLLKRNIFSISVCGQDLFFQVVDAFGPLSSRSSISDGGRFNSPKEKKPGTDIIQMPTLFVVGRMTRVKVEFSVPDANRTQVDGIAAGDEAFTKHIEMPFKQIEYSTLGGLSEPILTLKEIINFSLLQPERLLSLGLQPPRGVLLHGPPGTGKTSLALASASEAGVRMFSINGPEIISEYYGESEAALKAVFATAETAAPAVVFIDELDAIAPQRTEGAEDLGRRMVATLLTIMDGGNWSLQGVLVIAATNRLETIDPALRRPGRFDREIEIGVPSPSGRRDILQCLLARMSHVLTESDIESLAVATHGFVGADLASLCNEAAMVALRHFVHGNVQIKGHTQTQEPMYEWQKSCSISSELTSCVADFESLNLTVSNSALRVAEDQLKITLDDFEEAKTRVRPSAMREVMLEVPKVRWSDVGGQEEIKQQLKETVEWPQKHMDAFSRIGSQPPRGVLLYGPPGCSKTLMARAVATEAGLNFIAVKGPELFSKWVGESEKAVRSLFQRARVAAPSVVFFDELDGLAVSRDSSNDGVSVGDRVMSQLLVEMDGLSSRKGVTVIAATNRPDKIDAALLRPGRFDRLLYVGPPDEPARLQIFQIHTKDIPCAADVDKAALAKCTNGYTGADIAAICRASAMAALEEDLNAQQVNMRHFNDAICTVQPSTTKVSEFLYAHFSRGMLNMNDVS